MLGAIEAGGTKFVCAVGNRDNEIIDQITIPTISPEETLPKVLNFFETYRQELEAIAIASFGPIDVNHDSKTYGYITNTPKLKWRNTNLLGIVQSSFPNLPTVWTTDVNGSAYGEYTVHENINSLVYYTIGTGIGGGAIINGQLVQGKTHPEMGHVTLKAHEDDTFEGICPTHKSCFEGLASGPAIEARMKMKSKNIPADDPYWDIQAYYIAQSALNTSLMLTPDIIIYGGGVMKVEGLIEKVRHYFKELNNNYVNIPDLESYIVKPKLGDSAAIIGCFAQAKQSLIN